MEAGQRCAARYGCRGLLLMLHRAGHIGLPPVRYTPPNPLVRRARPAPVRMDTTPLQGLLSQLRPLHFQQVRRTGDEPVFNSLIEHHHYLGYQQPVGEHLKYLVWAQGRPVACLAWSSAPVTWAAATASSAGAPRPGVATFAFSLTTAAF